MAKKKAKKPKIIDRTENERRLRGPAGRPKSDVLRRSEQGKKMAKKK